MAVPGTSLSPCHDGTARYTASGVYRLWRQGGRRALRDLPEGLELTVPRIEARTYADIADGLLSAFGPKVWSWRDAHGRTAERGSLVVSAINVLRDLAVSPLLPRLHARHARRLQAIPDGRPSPPGDAPPLYVRTDHMFDLSAGGSVAHTAGVLNALRTLCGPVDVISTDRLALVEPDARFEVLTPRYGLGRNVPNMALLRYNDQLLARHGRRKAVPRFVYGRYSLGSYAALALARAARVPYVCEYNGSSIWMSRHWETRRLLSEKSMLAIEDANLNGADLVVAMSRASRDELVGRGVPDERILVNPNGVDVERFDVDGGKVRAKIGVGPDEILLGFVGTFGRWHGTTVLADGFARLIDLMPDRRSSLRLLMIGDGIQRAETEERLRASGAMDRAIFAGLVPQGDTPGYLAACDILVSPHVPNADGTPFFGSPTKLFEYMAARRAIVASDLDQMGEVLSDDETALLVTPGDPEALAEALRRAAGDAALRSRLADAARQVCEARHTWLNHTRRILDALAASQGC